MKASCTVLKTSGAGDGPAEFNIQQKIMIYYELGKDVEPKVVGVTHGMGQLKGKDLTTLNPWYDDIFFRKPKQTKDWWKYWAKCEHYAQEPMKGIYLEKKGNPTDYMEFGLRGFYVSAKLKHILEKAHLPNHKFIPTLLISEKTGEPIRDYWRFVYDMETGENTVDFSKSEYSLAYHKQKFGEEFTVTINSYQDYLNVFYQTGSAVSTSKLVFNSNFDRKLDLFGTQFLSNRKAYISQSLLNRWQEAQITGYMAISIEANSLQI